MKIMTIRKKLVATVAALAITASTALTGAAQVSDTSSVTVGSGSFTVALSASDFATLPYSLTDQYARGGQIHLTVQDQTGSAAGWQVTMSLTNFIGQSRPAQTPIPSQNLEIVSYDIAVATDGSQPISAPNMPVVYGETVPQLVWTALPGYGQGGYTLNMTGDLLVPGRTEAQTYTSTGTVEVVTAP